MSTETVKVVALVCERSVNFKGKLSDTGCMVENGNVHVIQVPCSGIIQPSMIESALKQGATGVITTGCRMGDCHYREGNKFLNDRLLGNRQPKLKASIDRKKIQAYWLSAIEYARFRELAGSFVQTLSNA